MIIEILPKTKAKGPEEAAMFLHGRRGTYAVYTAFPELMCGVQHTDHPQQYRVSIDFRRGPVSESLITKIVRQNVQRNTHKELSPCYADGVSGDIKQIIAGWL